MVCLVLIAGTYAPDRCGVAHYTARLRKALFKRGIQSVVLTTNETAQTSDDKTVLGAVQDWTLQNLLPLIQAIHNTKADILHIQHAAGTYGFDRAIFLLPVLLRLSGWQKPIIATIHEYGWWEWQPKWIPQLFLERLKTWGQNHQWWDREDGFLITQSNAIITTNREAEHVILDRLPHLRSQVHRIPIGANVEVFPIDRTTARTKLLQVANWTETVQVIAFFGFLHPVKGLETLLAAFQTVSNLHPSARLILIGGVESLALRGAEAKNYWEKLEKNITHLNLNDLVHMTGYVDAETASHYLTGSDIGVLPFNHGVTLKSGSLLALMAHGLPVIATQSSDPDLSQSLAKLIETRNSAALTDALIELLTDSITRSQLSKSGRDFSQQFDWSAIADAHLEIYRSNLQTAVTHA
jgi:glycosyltransferase involved in cell wall biosynthesis